jgi:hypothetical protein
VLWKHVGPNELNPMITSAKCETKQMTGITLRVALAVFAVGFCSWVTAESTASITHGEDIDVFRAVLSVVCDRLDGKLTIVSDMPPLSRQHDIPADWQSSSSLSMALSQRSQVRIQWPHVDVCPGTRLVDGATIDSLFVHDARVPPGWEAFHARFPKAAALVRVSLPAFSPDHKHAVAYMESRCNTSCGSGFYLELEKRKGKWQILRRDTAWIS